MKDAIKLQASVLAKLRYDKNITLKELSQLTGIQITRLFRLEKSHELMLSEIRALDAFYGVNLLELTIPPLPVQPRFKVDHNGVGYVITDTKTNVRCSMIMFKKQEALATRDMFEEFPDRVCTAFSKVGG